MIKKLLIMFVATMGLISFVSADVPYWIDDEIDKNYDLWVRVDIPANGNILLNISKGGGHPDGDAVFIFFDDFRGTTLDTSKWEIYGTPKIYDGKLIIDDINEGVRTIKTLGVNENVIVIWKLSSNSLRIPYVYFKEPDTANFGAGDANSKIFSQVDDLGQWRWYLEDGQHLGGSRKASGTFKLIWDVRNGVVKGYQENSEIWSENLNDLRYAYYDISEHKWKITSEKPDASEGFKFEIYVGPDGAPQLNREFEYVVVRKYADIEPEVKYVNGSANWTIVNITNPNDYDLIGFQVRIPRSKLGSVDPQYDKNLTITVIGCGSPKNPIKTPIPRPAIIIALMSISILFLIKRINS